MFLELLLELAKNEHNSIPEAFFLKNNVFKCDFENEKAK